MTAPNVTVVAAGRTAASASPESGCSPLGTSTATTRTRPATTAGSRDSTTARAVPRSRGRGGGSDAEDAVEHEDVVGIRRADLGGVPESGARRQGGVERFTMDAVSGEHDVDAGAPSGDVGGGEERVAAVVAGPGQDQDGTGRGGEFVGHDSGQRASGLAHERTPGGEESASAARIASAVYATVRSVMVATLDVSGAITRERYSSRSSPAPSPLPRGRRRARRRLPARPAPRVGPELHERRRGVLRAHAVLVLFVPTVT